MDYGLWSVIIPLRLISIHFFSEVNINMFKQVVYMHSYICNQQNLKADSFRKSYIILANCFATQDYPSRMSLYKQWIQLFDFIYWVFTLSFNEAIEASGDMKTRRAETWICIPALPLTSYDFGSVNLLYPLFLQLKIVNKNIYFGGLVLKKIHISCLKIRQLLWRYFIPISPMLFRQLLPFQFSYLYRIWKHTHILHG